MTLARFRVDPSKVRVGIRRDIICTGPKWKPGYYIITLTSIEDGRTVEVVSAAEHLSKGLACALTQARKRQFDGIDAKMQWAYPHPQRAQ